MFDFFQVYIEFCFKYLIKGCYKIYIEQSSGNGTQKRMHPPFKKIVWLQNSFTLKDFKLKPPKMGEYPQEYIFDIKIFWIFQFLLEK